MLLSLGMEQKLVDLCSECQGTAPWCLDLLSTPVQRWWWLSTSPEHLPSISKPPVLLSPLHHLCGAEGNDPFGWLPRHFLSNALSVALQTICCASACVSCSTFHQVPSHLSVLLWYSFLKVACGKNMRSVIQRLNQSLVQTTVQLSQTIQERGQKGRASVHYWQCTLPCCLTLFIYKSQKEQRELWLNHRAGQLNFSDAAVTICLDCNRFLNISRLLIVVASWTVLSQSLVIPHRNEISRVFNPLLCCS